MVLTRILLIQFRENAPLLIADQCFYPLPSYLITMAYLQQKYTQVDLATIHLIPDVSSY